jgi:hypothetical protein
MNNIHLNINLAIKADAMPDANAAYVATFIEALAAKGYQFSTESEKPVKVAQSAKEKGPLETLLLENTGKSRMKVPSAWEGTREEWAGKLLTGETPTENVTEEGEIDPMDVFHE